MSRTLYVVARSLAPTAWDPVVRRINQLGMAAEMGNTGCGDVITLLTEDPNHYVWIGVCPDHERDGPWCQDRDLLPDGPTVGWGYARSDEQMVGGIAYRHEFPLAYERPNGSVISSDDWMSDDDWERIEEPGNDDSIAEAVVRVGRRLLVAPMVESM